MLIKQCHILMSLSQAKQGLAYRDGIALTVSAVFFGLQKLLHLTSTKLGEKLTITVIPVEE